MTPEDKKDLNQINDAFVSFKGVDGEALFQSTSLIEVRDDDGHVVLNIYPNGKAVPGPGYALDKAVKLMIQTICKEEQERCAKIAEVWADEIPDADHRVFEDLANEIRKEK
jgi:hypothetical protein